METCLEKELESVLPIVKEAGEEIMYFHGRSKASKKADGTLVTEADKVSHIVLTDRLRDLFPKDDILSEESSDTRRFSEQLYRNPQSRCRREV